MHWHGVLGWNYKLNSYQKMIKNNIPFILTLLTILLVTLTHSKLEVNNYDKLPKELQDETLKDIPYSVANFGFAPFGKTMVGTLQISPGMNKECDALDQIFEDQNNELVFENSFMLIPRGQCKFVTKALHAQDLGARMAIIMDNIDQKQKIIMKDDGFGYKVKIPSIFISHEYGQKLTNLARDLGKKVQLKIHFYSVKQDIADVTFYMQAMNRMSYHIVESFKSSYDSIKDFVNLAVVYDVKDCPYCHDSDCYFSKTICSTDYQHGTSANGKMILDQQLREKLIFLNHREKWWPYIACINAQCSIVTQLEMCSKTCEQRNGLIDFKKTFDASFTPKDNIYLYEDLQKLRNSGIDVFPSVTINSLKMKGSLEGSFILDDICNSLNNPPKECRGYLQQNRSGQSSESRFYWMTVILVILGAGIVFTLLFIVCKRIMKRRMTMDMQGRVDDMVSKYIQFYSQRNNNRG